MQSVHDWRSLLGVGYRTSVNSAQSNRGGMDSLESYWGWMNSFQKNWSWAKSLYNHWGWAYSLHRHRMWAFNGGGHGCSVGWLRGFGAWFVGVDCGAKTGSVGDVIDSAVDTSSVRVAVGANLAAELVTGFLTCQTCTKLISVVEGEAVGLRRL
ncbi:hypothetical protein HPB47_021423 [Ixodes persulcatus]|uniref:Uncharacterized protein n=1 Tax=Ixodes persulcatus TaxID=34615 RepID=A0AC60QCS6_IXOPE|nr:hypothetical protein HPB47_021423 [Ixodes persulcatus]